MGQFEKQARGEINLVLDIPCIRKDGSVFYADINSFDITIDGIKYLAGIFRDITGRKKTEEILLSYQNKLEEMLKKKTLELVKAQKDIQDATRLSDIGTLAATIAHELRNPLGVIKVAVYNIKRKTPGDMIDDHIDNINKKIGECDRIIKNLLSYSHIKISNYENIRIMDV
ncbi:PAS domain S-box protein, partial [Candidatus Desantisbacteria bacterium]|nr:PAS domain S-box protein [Candidatus Desantisbacteria bacterium]